MKLTQQQLEAHLWGAANILRGKTAGQDYKNYILSLMFYKRLCDQWENEADEAIADLERQQGRQFTEAQKAVFRARGEHRFSIPDGSRWGDVLAESTNLGEKLTQAMRAVAYANEELKGVFTVDWNQPAPDGSGKPLIPNEVVHALIQHFDSHDLSNASVPPDILGRAYEYLIKQFADDAGAKAGEFFTPPEVVDTLVRILEPCPGDTVYESFFPYLKMHDGFLHICLINRVCSFSSESISIYLSIGMQSASSTISCEYSFSQHFCFVSRAFRTG